jgi:hypothetical protein
MESARWQTVSLVRAVTVASTYWRTGAAEADRMYVDGMSLIAGPAPPRAGLHGRRPHPTLTQLVSGAV